MAGHRPLLVDGRGLLLVAGHGLLVYRGKDNNYTRSA